MYWSSLRLNKELSTYRERLFKDVCELPGESQVGYAGRLTFQTLLRKAFNLSVNTGSATTTHIFIIFIS